MEPPAEGAPEEKPSVSHCGPADACFDICQYKGKVIEVYWTIIKNEGTELEEATHLARDMSDSWVSLQLLPQHNENAVDSVTLILLYATPCYKGCKCLMQWWPGKIGEPVQDAAGEPKRHTGGDIIYVIDYEEYGEFEAEQCQVAFLSPRVLRDMDSEAFMAWRVQGDTWEDAATALKEYADESEAEDEVVTASEFLQRQMSELQDATGVASEEEGMQRLEANLPRQTVINGARAMREFTNLFKAHMDKFRESGGNVVTKEVVDEFVSSLRASRAP